MAKLEQYIVKGGKSLRLGYTTGSCAAAAAKAAAMMLLSGEKLFTVRLETPKGISLLLDLEDVSLEPGRFSCAVRKDAGDDPDVTDGLLVYASVTRSEREISLLGGAGIGRAERDGLPCEKGGHAINPEPRRQIIAALREVCKNAGYSGGLEVMIWVPEGERVAKKTFNPRLGIMGGISILGTTGIVEPMSEQALVDTIRAELRTRKAMGQRILVLAPGHYGEAFLRERLAFDIGEAALCSNYIGETLDYAAYLGFEAVLLVGHGGKLIKTAGGIMQTHSAVADCRMELLAAYAGVAGALPEQLVKLVRCVTIEDGNLLLREWGLLETTWRELGSRIHFHLNNRTRGGVPVEHIVFTHADGILSRSEGAEALLRQWREQKQ